MRPGVIHVDLSEIVATPSRSGIQRVEREAIRHWPGPAPLCPCCVDAQGRLLRLPEAVLDVLCADDEDATIASREAERQALARSVAAGCPVEPRGIERLLNLELFYDAVRATAHLRLAAAGVPVLWLVHDFLPFLRPQLFAPGVTKHGMHFLTALRRVKGLAFVSEQTRCDYAKRVARTGSVPPSWPVIHPGADGLRLERQHFSPDRQHFVSIGTVEPRKNTIALLRAFETLWDRGREARLIVAGRLSPDATDALAFFRKFAADPRLRVMNEPCDEELRSALRSARAVVMPSEAEGFGLPPYEALSVGIPAVASRHLPSASLMSNGALLLERMTPEAIAAAVETLLDEETAARLWAQAARVHLPTWRDFSRLLAAWAHAP
jgi:glycosyltransferase involved in cell wall biosynthesis